MGTHPIFESDFDCLTDEFGLNDSLFRRGGECRQELQDQGFRPSSPLQEHARIGPSHQGHALEQGRRLLEGGHRQGALYPIQSVQRFHWPHRPDQGVQVANVEGSLAREVVPSPTLRSRVSMLMRSLLITSRSMPPPNNVAAPIVPTVASTPTWPHRATSRSSSPSVRSPSPAPPSPPGPRKSAKRSSRSSA